MYQCIIVLFHRGLYGPRRATKSAFNLSAKGDSNKSLKVQRLARKLKISLVASLDMILSDKRIANALSGCTDPRRQVFTRRGPIT